ncbi:MAG: response regulator transcription factor [Gemmatimonadaceae bacterium]
MKQATRVLIADDHAVVREGIRHVLDAASDFEVVAEAASGMEALRLAEKLKPHVVVLDISMPDGTGFETLAHLRRSVPTARVLILSIHDDPRYVLESVRAGAHGYLCKDSPPAELRDAIRALHRGETYYSPAVAQRLSAAQEADNLRVARTSRFSSLTPRERDVLRGIVKGLTNKEIAAHLQISSRTVESHRESLMQKLDVKHVAALTRLALEAGLTEP